MGVDVIVLNGASSVGKSSVARCLQDVLPSPWLTLGIDDLIHALPLGLDGSDSGSRSTARASSPSATRSGRSKRRGTWGSPPSREVASASSWTRCSSGAASQGRLRNALVGLDVLWVGVHCELDTLVAR